MNGQHTHIPCLILPDQAVQRCFEAALHNITEINTVPCDYAVYNATSLLNYPYMLRAGGNYDTPWTRDASINTWNGMCLLSPETARTTLLAVCVNDAGGNPIIQPDVQIWDKIVWAIGARSYWLATGDREFLDIAFGVILRALTELADTRLNREFGLFRGGSFFNDGIAGYPLSNHQPGNPSSFAPDHPAVETLMCLSTNCLYCEAFRILSEMASFLGDTVCAAEAERFHRKLKENIHRRLWNPFKCRYDYILYPDGSRDTSQEAAGNAFAVLFSICPEEYRDGLLKGLTISERGLVSIHPPFPGLFSQDHPGRHNNLIWPFLNGIFIRTAGTRGLSEIVGQELRNITALVKGSGYGFFEVYNPYTGDVDGGWQCGHVWESCRDQSWSASGYISAILHGVFGLDVGINGIRFRPCVPDYLENAAIRKLTVRGMSLSVQILGSGTGTGQICIDGQAVSDTFLPYDGNHHDITIKLL